MSDSFVVLRSRKEGELGVKKDTGKIFALPSQKIKSTRPSNSNSTPVPSSAESSKRLAKSRKNTNKFELVEKPFIVTEYQQAEYWCEKCQCTHTAPLPIEVKKLGLFGKNLTALTAHLKGRCHMSFTTIQCFYADAFGLKVSTGYLTKQIRRTSEALKGVYDKLVEQLPKEEHLHCDETGSKENGKRRWGRLF